MKVGHHGFELVEPMCYRYKLWSQIINVRHVRGILFTYAKRQTLGSVTFACLQGSHCTYFSITSASPFGFTISCFRLTYCLSKPLWLQNPLVFLRVSHGHLQWEICHELQRASLDGAIQACSVWPEPPFKGSEILQAEDIHQARPPSLSKTSHFIMKFHARFAHVTCITESSLKCGLFCNITMACSVTIGTLSRGLKPILSDSRRRDTFKRILVLGTILP